MSFSLAVMAKNPTIYILFEFEHTEYFTSHRGYLLNTKL